MHTGIRVAATAMLCAILGICCYRLQGDAEPFMNTWGVVSFGALGASLGCLIQDDRSRAGSSGNRWW